VSLLPGWILLVPTSSVSPLFPYHQPTNNVMPRRSKRLNPDGGFEGLDPPKRSTKGKGIHRSPPPDAESSAELPSVLEVYDSPERCALATPSSSSLQFKTRSSKFTPDPQALAAWTKFANETARNLPPPTTERLINALLRIALVHNTNPFPDVMVSRALKKLDEKSYDMDHVSSALLGGRWGDAVLLLQASASEVGPAGSNLGETLSQLDSCWRDEYRGESLHGLMTTIEEYEKNWTDEPGTRYYSKCLNIFQSSGMGKSRTASELGKFWFEFNFVFRNPGETGYPSGDPEVYRYLMDKTIGSDSAKVWGLLAAIGEIGVFFLPYNGPHYVYSI